MINHLTFQRTVVAGIAGICLIALPSVAYLSWAEGLRFAFVLLGLIALYLRWFRKKKPDHNEPEVQKQPLPFVSSVLSIAMMFVITQFDPATAALSLHESVGRLNFFFVASSLMIVLMGCALVVTRPDVFLWQKLRSIDIWVFFIGIGIILVSIFAKVFIGNQFGWNDIFAYVKVFSYVVLWFVISHAFTEPIAGDNKYVYNSFVCFLALGVIACSYCFYQTGRMYYHVNLGARAFEQKKWNEALSHYSSARDLNRIVNLDFARNIYLSDLAVLNLSQENVEDSQIVLEEIKSKIYDEAERHQKVGDVFYRAEKWHEARVEYEAFSNKYGKREDVLDRLGQIYLLQNETRRFLKLLERYKYFPNVKANTFDDFMFLGNLYLYREMYSQSQMQFQEALQLQPQNAYAVYKVGRVYLAQGDYENALRYFKDAVALKSDLADAYYRAGVCLEQMNDIRGAREMYEKTIQILPNHLDGLKALLTVGLE